MSKRPGCLPTAEQEYLLRAALLEGPEARAAWLDWLALSGEGWIKDELDVASSRLLPSLYMNVANIQPVAPDLLDKLKRAYIVAFCNSQALFERTGIKTILLKGAALALLYYKDAGLRPMVDVDILVPTGKANQAIELLTKLDWQPGFKAPHSQSFKSTESGVEIDLHWQALIGLNDIWQVPQKAWKGLINRSVASIKKQTPW